MRTVGKGVTEIYEVDVEPPGPGEVQVRKTACGVCAADTFAFGHEPEEVTWNVPGHEGVGVVTEVGPFVSGVSVGDYVAGAGGFASVQNVGAGPLHHIPGEVTDPALWVAEPVACVVNGLDQAAVRAGERVALVGAGFMGLLLLQGLLRCPCSTLTVMDIDAHRLGVARQLGAGDTIDLADAPDTAASLENAFDVVIDTTGAQGGLDTAVTITRSGGKLVLFGWIHGPAQISGDVWHMKGQHVVNASPSSAASMSSCWQRSLAGIESGLFDLGPLTTHRGPLDELPELLAAGGEKRDGYIKGVVVYD